MRPGLGMSGVAALVKFVEDGGLLITARDTSEWAVTYGLARWVSIVPTNKLKLPLMFSLPAAPPIKVLMLPTVFLVPA